MSINPFDDENGSMCVLVDGEEQLSRLRTFTDLPVGWQVVDGGAEPAARHDDIERNWPDSRPKVLRDRLIAGGASDK